MQLYIFPLRHDEINDPFAFNADETTCYSDNYWTENNLSMSEKFNKQVKLNYFKVLIHDAYDIEFVKDEKVNEEIVNEIKKRKEDDIDVLSRDCDAMKQSEIDVQLYVVLAMKDNEYYGHIYTWISPVVNTISFAIGIRSRVDAPVLKKENRYTPVAHYLLYGVKMFALKNGCKKVIIPSPLESMFNILKQERFYERTEIQMNKLAGRSLAPEGNVQVTYQTLILERLLEKNVPVTFM